MFTEIVANAPDKPGEGKVSFMSKPEFASPEEWLVLELKI